MDIKKSDINLEHTNYTLMDRSLLVIPSHKTQRL